MPQIHEMNDIFMHTTRHVGSSFEVVATSVTSQLWYIAVANALLRSLRDQFASVIFNIFELALFSHCFDQNKWFSRAIFNLDVVFVVVVVVAVAVVVVVVVAVVVVDVVDVVVVAVVVVVVVAVVVVVVYVVVDVVVDVVVVVGVVDVVVVVVVVFIVDVVVVAVVTETESFCLQYRGSSSDRKSFFVQSSKLSSSSSSSRSTKPRDLHLSKIWHRCCQNFILF